MTTMTLEQVRDWLLAEAEAFGESAVDHLRDAYKNAADAIDAHLAQPAQAVDVGEIQEVLSQMSKETNGFDFVKNWQKKLTRALSGEKAGPVGDGFVDRVLRVAAHMRMADWLGADGTLSDYDRLQALLPASPTPGKEGA